MANTVVILDLIVNINYLFVTLFYVSEYSKVNSHTREMIRRCPSIFSKAEKSTRP